jgi:hypothetical protein
MSAIQRQKRQMFPWRQPLLEALRQDPNMRKACRAAAISRNSAYTHIRHDGVFRRQIERAIDRGREKQYRKYREQLAQDPSYQRAMARALEAALWWQSSREAITDSHN